ncbi:MAG: Zn-ribbon domain-containing OB-fold protein [Anaerolineales bacterium]
MNRFAGMETSQHWRLKQQRYALVGEVCPHCTSKIFPPRDLCPDCGEDARDLYQFSGRGEVYSHTTVYQAPSGHTENAPYPVAIVRLEEGPLVTAQLTDIGDQPVEIGTQVEMVTRKLGADGERGMLVYGYKFRPTLAER